MLDLVYENQTGDAVWSKFFFRRVLEAACAHLGLEEKKVEVGVHLVTPERSRDLNLEHRLKDKPTDVLSFPLDEHGLEKYDILPVGDIFICLEVAQRQAREMDIPLNQELARLAIHGFLHLLGYDHEKSPEEEKRMIDLQEDILRAINF